ncbi:MAG: arylsulfatase [Saprospiraceae bacterium]|nr:arylsulfatase [Saprospiraceae bacterium]
MRSKKLILNYRQSLRAILTLPIVAFFFLCGCSQKNRNQRPNIIVLYADDMGYGDLGIQNPDSKIPTPNLDQLAQEGMLFSDAHSSSGICTPSRYALLTGRHHWRDFHDIVGPMGPSVFTADQYTMPEMLRNNGYNTACIGKWHLGWDWESIRIKSYTTLDSMMLFGRMKYFYPSQAYNWNLPIPDGPLAHGFDYYFGDGTINFPPYAWVENDRVLQEPTVTMTTPVGMALEGNWEARPGPALEDWDFFKVLPSLTEKAVAYVQRQKDQEKPFFLYMPFPSPHAPIIPNEEFRGKSLAGPYGDFVFQTDWCAGQILKALDDIGETGNTIVIFTADNGPERYAYDRIRNFDHHSSAPFRGLKRDIYEGGHHVPFIVRWPNKVEAGAVCDEVISQVDILQTIASIIGAELPSGLAHDSHDFSRVWLGENYNTPIRSATTQNTFKDRYALRMGDWVYINHKSGYHTNVPDWVTDKFGYAPLADSVQLYNLKDDIGQKNNLAGIMPEQVIDMQEKLELILQQETFIEK